MLAACCAALTWPKQSADAGLKEKTKSVCSLAGALLVISHCDLDLPLLMDICGGKKDIVGYFGTCMNKDWT